MNVIHSHWINRWNCIAYFLFEFKICQENTACMNVNQIMISSEEQYSVFTFLPSWNTVTRIDQNSFKCNLTPTKYTYVYYYILRILKYLSLKLYIISMFVSVNYTGLYRSLKMHGYVGLNSSRLSKVTILHPFPDIMSNTAFLSFWCDIEQEETFNFIK